MGLESSKIVSSGLSGSVRQSSQMSAEHGFEFKISVAPQQYLGICSRDIAGGGRCSKLVDISGMIELKFIYDRFRVAAIFLRLHQN